MTLGLSSRTGPFGGPTWDGSLLSSNSQHTAQSPFRSRVAMGGDGGVSDKEFLEVFVCKINRLGAREGCGRLFLLGGRVDLAGILRSDDCCRPPTGEVLIGRQGHASWSVEPREAFEGPLGQGRSRRELLWRAEDIRGFTARSKGWPGGARRWWGPSWTHRRPGARLSPTSEGPAGSPCSSVTPYMRAHLRPGSQCSCLPGGWWSRRS